MSLTSVDLPDPLTPVTAVSTPSGIATSMFFRLFSRAPRIDELALESPAAARVGVAIDALAAQVRAGQRRRRRRPAAAAGVPWKITWPPCSPAPGPRSIT